jgi:hypothetical protein
MKTIITLFTFCLSFSAMAQNLDNIISIDSVVLKIDSDPTITRKVFDTVRYVREDGGDRWDSAYTHREYFFKNDKVVKITGWGKYGRWRNDMLAYYHNEIPIKFSKGEGHEGTVNYEKLNFAIYYFQEKAINVTWLTPKPANVLGVATEVFLTWAYNLLKESR